MTPKPYVGVTGAITCSEVDSVVQKFLAAGFTMNSAQMPMLGFLVSYKTLNHLPTQNRRYPTINSLPALVAQAGNKVLTMIHYNSKEISTLADQVGLIFSELYNEKVCKALQLNVVWPDIKQVMLIKNKFPEMQTVLQLSHKAVEGKQNGEIVEEAAKYGSSIDYVLIDPSGGRGQEFDIENSCSLYAQLAERLPLSTLGFAGGFTGANVNDRIKEISKKIGTSTFCIDAEGGLRDKITNEYGDDLLNIQKVGEYIQEAAKAMH